MALHFQVYADFTLTHGKPQLIKTSIYSTKAGCSSIPFWPNPATFLTISRIFPTLRLARSYITYLSRAYPDSPAPAPIFDEGQLNLFSEVL